jgi:hypothetical protein
MNQRLNDQLIDTEERHRQDVMQRIQAAPTTQTPTYYPQQYIQPAPQPQISPAEEASISAALKQSSVQPVTHYKQTKTGQFHFGADLFHFIGQVQQILFFFLSLRSD